MKRVFLESHNLKNRTSGFGVFNYELIKAIERQHPEDLEITLNLKNKSHYQQEFGDFFKYNLYTGLQRNKLFRITKKFDVWHSLNQNIKVEPMFKQKKYILTVHDVNFAQDEKNKTNLSRIKLFKEKLKKADLITYISHYAKEQTYKFFEVPAVEERIIYNGNPIREIYDLSKIRPKVPVDRPYFYSIGDFLEKKNFHSLVRMMKEIPDYELILSGSNKKVYGDFIRSLIAELRLEDRVILTGRVSEEEKQYYIQNSEAFLFPSIGEGFGLPPIEAMAFGKPVFLSNQASLPEIGADAAFYWEDFDPIYMKEFLFKKLDEFHQNPAFFQEKLKTRAAFFNWDETAKQYIDCYRF